MVIDMQGLGMSVLRYIATLKEMSKIATHNYPEIASSIYLVNPPWGFQSEYSGGFRVASSGFFLLSVP